MILLLRADSVISYISKSNGLRQVRLPNESWLYAVSMEQLGNAGRLRQIAENWRQDRSRTVSD